MQLAQEFLLPEVQLQGQYLYEAEQPSADTVLASGLQELLDPQQNLAGAMIQPGNGEEKCFSIAGQMHDPLKQLDEELDNEMLLSELASADLMQEVFSESITLQHPQQYADPLHLHRLFEDAFNDLQHGPELSSSLHVPGHCGDQTDVGSSRDWSSREQEERLDGKVLLETIKGQAAEEGRQHMRRRLPDPMHRNKLGQNPGTKRRRATLGSRSGSSEPVTEAQKHRSRELARRLRQKKANEIERLQEDVLKLSCENRSLIARLKRSLAALDDVNHQNTGLQTVLQALQPVSGQKASGHLASLAVKASLEQPSAAHACMSRDEAEELAMRALFHEGGRGGPALQQLVQFAVNQPLCCG